MDAAELTRTVRSLNGLSRTQLGQMAQLSPSTISRIERRQLDPSWSSMMSILSSGGFAFADKLRPVGDTSAVAAARSVIDEDYARFEAEPALTAWIDRWTRAGLVENGRIRTGEVGAVALLAGNAARFSSRPKTRDYAYSVPWQSTAAALKESGLRYAMTGMAAAEGGDSRAGSEWPILYVDDPKKAGEALNLEIAQEGQRRLTLAPFDPTSRAGVWEDQDGFSWVDPVQGLVDAYASPGRSADRADALLPRFERRTLIKRLSA